ncbi:hypothetical protein AVEN_59215-1 [Araneus ventricosus]|uniref:Secreted protein n=1 Tax=Araneus ventricosus TaxID=182803 RepID=A0A4Y2UU09_ARAVE|nr:hypothetical protein AVEN_59215-1 [Araneus ventricosus]
MVTSMFALTCCSLVMNLRSCRAELAASLQTCIARLLQLCCKLKLLYGCIFYAQRGTLAIWQADNLASPPMSVAIPSMILHKGVRMDSERNDIDPPGSACDMRLKVSD